MQSYFSNSFSSTAYKYYSICTGNQMISSAILNKWIRVNFSDWKNSRENLQGCMYSKLHEKIIGPLGNNTGILDI